MGSDRYAPGGLAPTISFFSITKNPVDYLNGVYAAGKVNSPRSLYNGLRGAMAAYGVYRTDWTPKPAADVMKSLA